MKVVVITGAIIYKNYKASVKPLLCAFDRYVWSTDRAAMLWTDRARDMVYGSG